ncbi:uncharacterized protein N7483_005009 [Penicillium malachiteum]|uniref:uncharacterized protein n=1 Tax=Penicillium malachiteum TaxID=1324776 RepID=UPI0025472DFE|nr:uncharacterized protein N7483_005009 [Penicillium malachiteum]KAJ5730501.1 hypothetical protein N7483_005009 [Penicillium malachiteum]
MAGFDVATGALGLVSVGIQAFSGILDYYQAYKDFDDDIAQILLQAGILRATLCQLDEKLRVLQSPKSPLTPQAECAVVSIQHCEHGINRVNTQLEKCRSSLRSEPVSKARHRLDRMLYPFRKEKLKELLKILDSLRGNINNSAGMVHLAVSMANSEKADLMISKSESTMDAVHVLSQQQKNTNHRLDQVEFMMREIVSLVPVSCHVVNEMLILSNTGVGVNSSQSTTYSRSYQPAIDLRNQEAA